MTKLTGHVGLKAQNRPEDVALLRRMFIANGYETLKEGTRVDQTLVNLIRYYQKRTGGEIDGVVRPDDNTFRKLLPRYRKAEAEEKKWRQFLLRAQKAGGLRELTWRGRKEWMLKDEADRLEARMWKTMEKNVREMREKSDYLWEIYKDYKDVREGVDGTLARVGAAIADSFDKQPPLKWSVFSDLQNHVDSLESAVRTRNHRKAAEAYGKAAGSYSHALWYTDDFMRRNLGGAETGLKVAKFTAKASIAVIAAFAGPTLAGATIARFTVSEFAACTIVGAAEWGGYAAIDELELASAGKGKGARKTMWNIGRNMIGGAIVGRVSKAIKLEGKLGKYVVEGAAKKFGQKLPWLASDRCMQIVTTLFKEAGQDMSRGAVKQIVKLAEKSYSDGKLVSGDALKEAAWAVFWDGVFSGPLAAMKKMGDNRLRANEEALRAVIPRSRAWKKMQGKPGSDAMRAVFEGMRKTNLKIVMKLGKDVLGDVFAAKPNDTVAGFTRRFNEAFAKNAEIVKTVDRAVERYVADARKKTDA
ncbi:hypothetical protein LNKW23_45900 [Paralimibaculum aggregatum]|uniref:Peptidoglycan binding-like domain-containing protein n=1 Tax=Paralimibaculum aggregatum TaxID=3036245 RepID=A0ABQ6LTF4_9RHOB|nr:peptidoglycan-binding domain-containing protein [Limibaculum sp. NKW23]GMG85370.1 hypothetical protein LNKW23_45900 [Limibaculum sp. NKW23]